MEPIPESRLALSELAEYTNSSLAERISDMAKAVEQIAPGCIGLSLTLLEDDLTFTLVASSDLAEVLDAVQYLDGGPCVIAADRDHRIAADPEDPLDEERWSMYARASAARGVASSLSLPIHAQGETVGSVNLYGATEDTFHGRHEALAAALDAPAHEAVNNADLDFRSRVRAARAPSRVRELPEIDHAAGMIALSHGVDSATAKRRLRQAAVRAGIDDLQAARLFAGLANLGSE